MNQKALEAAIRSCLLAALPAGWALPVIAGNQPTTQGVEDAGVYFFRISDTKRGWQPRKYSHTLMQTESQWSESDYQFQAQVRDLVEDDAQMLAADVLDVVRSSVSSLTMAESLAALGIGIQRPTDILAPVFVNDEGQFETNANFTVKFSHRRDIMRQAPEAVAELVGIQRF